MAKKFKMTLARRRELYCLLYFDPKWCKYRRRERQDIIQFFEYSEHGKNDDLIHLNHRDGFNHLVQCKSWRGIHAHEMYEEGILDGSVPYLVLLEGMPLVVVQFLSREMFKGADASLIMKVYKELKKGD